MGQKVTGNADKRNPLGPIWRSHVNQRFHGSKGHQVNRQEEPPWTNLASPPHLGKSASHHIIRKLMTETFIPERASSIGHRDLEIITLKTEIMDVYVGVGWA